MATLPSGEERSVVGAIWPLLVTVFVGNLPYPASSIFVGSLAADFGVESATIGGLRAVGGAAALMIGFLAAPLLDRVPRAVTVLLGLGLVMVGSLLPLLGEMVTLTASFFAVGAAMAILVPAVQAAGGDLFDGPNAGRAAALVNGGQEGAAVRWWRDPLTLLVLGTLASVGLAPLTFLAPSALLAIVATTVYAMVHGVLVAAQVSLLVRRYMSLRGPVMALNGVGQNIGTVVGAAVAGLGIAAAGYDGLALTLVLMTGAAAITLLMALPTLRARSAGALEPSLASSTP